MATVTTTTAAPPLVPNARKRKVVDAEIDERPRGRPRKSSKDEAAVERRRTQIRIAQRAYRQRKETTIEELRSRVSDLTCKVEMMNRALHDFAQTATTRGLHSETKKELETMIFKFTPVVAGARNPSKSAPAVGVDSVIQNISAVMVDPMQRNHDDVDGPVPLDHVDIGMGYSLSYEEQPHHQATPTNYERNAGTSPAPHLSPVDSMDLEEPSAQQGQNGMDTRTKQQQQETHLSRISQPFLDTVQYETCLVPRSSTMPVVHSYSNFERSFARRLQRRCLESGWELISNYNQAPHTYNRVFRLPRMLGRSQAAFKHAFTAALRRTINDDLDSSISPLANVGGAGLHYPHEGSGLRNSGGKTEQSQRLDMIASSVPGFEGEWLDPQDVQGYLHDKGIKVDGAGSYVHARLPLSYLTGPAHTSAIENFLAGIDPHAYNLAEAEAFHRHFLSQHDEQNATPLSGSIITSAVATAENEDITNNTVDLWDADLSGVALGSSSDLIGCPGLNFFPTSGVVGDAGDATISRCQTHVGGVASTYEESPRVSSAGSSPVEGYRSGSSGPKARSVSSAGSVESPTSTTGYHAGMPPSPPDEIVTVTIDTNKLVKGMIMSSVCLGRAPGFRREMVDAAVRASVIKSS